MLKTVLIFLMGFQTISQAQIYRFVSSDEIESFSGNYVEENIYLECKRINIKEDETYGFEVLPICKNSEGKYDKRGFNHFKIKLVLKNKELINKILTNKKKAKIMMGKLIRNPKYTITGEYLFTIEKIESN